MKLGTIAVRHLDGGIIFVEASHILCIREVPDSGTVASVVWLANGEKIETTYGVSDLNDAYGLLVERRYGNR